MSPKKSAANEAMSSMIKRQCLAFVIGFCFVLSSNAQDKPVIEVITGVSWPLSGVQALQRQGYTIKVYNLDDGKRLVKSLARNLPPNQAAAKQQLLEHFDRLGKSRVRAQFMQAFQGQIISAQYGINRFPAVVFDHGQAVIYGVTDMHSALRRYVSWRKNR
jgi:integrating conjugative element protein (TIGR03757 family)